MLVTACPTGRNLHVRRDHRLHWVKQKIKGVTGNMKKRNRTSCFLCGAEGELAYSEKIAEEEVSNFTYSSRKKPELLHYEYLHCAQCDLRFSSHVPAASELDKNYADADFDSGFESHFAAKTYSSVLSRYLSPRVKTLLDVGCGDGAFLVESLAKGVRDIAGIEPSQKPASQAATIVKSKIFVGPWQDFTSSRKFSAITLFQTIEHLESPEEFVQFSRDKLEPGGILAIVAHDFRSIINKALSTKSPIFDIEHLQLFSKKSLTLLFENYGFVVLKNTSFINKYPLSYLIRLSPLPAKVKESWLFCRSPIAKFALSVPLGNRIVVGRVP